MRVPLALASAGTGVALRTIQRWAADGRLTVARSGRSWLVDPMEVAELDELRRAGRLTAVR